MKSRGIDEDAVGEAAGRDLEFDAFAQRGAQEERHIFDDCGRLHGCDDGVCLAGINQHLARQAGGTIRGSVDVVQVGRCHAIRSRFELRERAALPRITCSRLLKSCATPPASTRKPSSF